MLEVGHFVAQSDIRPGRVVKIVGPFQAAEATGTGATSDRAIVGIAAAWAAKPTGFTGDDKAAVAGQLVRVYQNGEVALALAATSVSAGDLLTAEGAVADARVRPLPAFNAAGANERSYVVVGQALHSASTNEYVRVLVKVQAGVYNRES